jgi:DNA replicative helicase MCM subunit Mcm2 (Cdc46/Mcm family)
MSNISQQDEILSDSAIVDLIKPILTGSKIPYGLSPTKNYHSLIEELINQGYRGNVILEFMSEDLPNELKFSFWNDGKETRRILNCLNIAIQQIFENIFKKENNKQIPYDNIEARIAVNTAESKDTLKIRNVRHPKNINKLVTFDGIIISKSKVLDDVISFTFKCYSCGYLYRNDKPRSCEECDSRKIDIAIDECGIRNYEVLTIQEHQKDMVLGSNELDTIDVHVYGSMVGKFNAGNHVRVMGFPKVFSPKGDEKISRGYKTGMLSISSLVTVVEAHNIAHMKTPYELLLLNPSKFVNEQDEKAILNLRKKYNDQELLNILVNSFAPNIYGMQAIKEALLLQAIGGSKIEGERPNIHTLVIGDPGMAKSKLAYEYKKILLHAVLAVGFGSSGVGLTVSHVTVNGQPRPNIGAAVFANNGVLILDELSGVNSVNRDHLRECMENGTITINKQGINQTFTANISLLAITNPDNGRYSVYNSLTENLEISPPLLSRFDFIFVIIDSIDVDEDQKLNIHSAARWNETKPPTDFIQQSNDTISTDLLKKWLVYATIHNQKVKITKPALKRFDNFYKDLRRPEKSADITATRRQYEGLRRISTALSRLLLKKEVTEEIADHVIQLLNHAYESTGMRLGNSTGLNQNTIFAKDLTKMNEIKAAMEVIEFLTEKGKKPQDREAIMMGFINHIHIMPQESADLFEKVYTKLLMPVNNKFILDVPRKKEEKEEKK